jgi:hypothetical protein
VISEDITSQAALSLLLLLLLLLLPPPPPPTLPPVISFIHARYMAIINAVLFVPAIAACDKEGRCEVYRILMFV